MRDPYTETEVLGCLATAWALDLSQEGRAYRIAKVLAGAPSHKRKNVARVIPRIQSVTKSLHSLMAKRFVEHISGKWLITPFGFMAFWVRFYSRCGPLETQRLAEVFKELRDRIG